MEKLCVVKDVRTRRDRITAHVNPVSNLEQTMPRAKVRQWYVFVM